MKNLGDSFPKMHRNAVPLALFLLSFLSFTTSANSLQYQCGGALQFKWRCEIVKLSISPAISALYEGVRRIDLSFCYNKKGIQIEEKAEMIHVRDDERRNASPLSWFNDVQFYGSRGESEIRWKGKDPKVGPKGMRMRGRVAMGPKKITSYQENVYKGWRRIGLVEAKCFSRSPYKMPRRPKAPEEPYWGPDDPRDTIIKAGAGR